MPEGDAKQYTLADDPAFKELKTFLGGLATLVKSQGQSIVAMGAKLNEQKPAGGEQNGGGNDEKPEGDGGDLDVDTLSKKDFFTFVMKEIGKVLDTKLSEVNEKVEGGIKEFRMGRLHDEAGKFAGDHKDFYDWSDEMGVMAKQHPTLGLSQLYKLVRDANPDKAKTLDDKYKEKPEPTQDISLFGGFRPTRSPDGSNGDGEEKLTMDQALDKGWADVISKFPSLGKQEDVLD